MKTLTLSLMSSLAIFTSLTAQADRNWNAANNPANIETNYLYNFNVLPITGTITDSNKAWSDSYWPATRGYIADRWQVPSLAYHFKDYALVSSDQVPFLSQEEIKLLSPAEKFDLVRGRFDFPIATKLREKNPSPSDWWRGVCNGWTQAALNYDEPQSIVYRSRTSGITVPFGSSDIKALLAYYYAIYDNTGYSAEQVKANPNIGYIGKACKGYKKLFLDFDGGCSDMNAGAFHVAIANELGLRHRGVAMDLDPSQQVWNQPVVGFESKVLNITNKTSKKATKGTVKEVSLMSTITYVDELYSTTDPNLESDRNVAPQYEALGHGKQHYSTATFQYVLELDAYDQIIGGEWINGSSHPDFIWKQPFNPKGLAYDTAGYPEDWTILADIVRIATEYGKSTVPAAKN